MDEEVKFYTEGLGMKVVRQREVNGARNVFVAYGEETLANKDGGGKELMNESNIAIASNLCVFGNEYVDADTSSIFVFTLLIFY